MKPIFEPGERVSIPSGKTGTVLPPPWEMPFHELIAFDQGGKAWIPYWLLVRIDLDAS